VNSEIEEHVKLKPWAPKSLSPRHKTVLALYAAGVKPGEIADALQMSGSRVSVIINDPRADELIKQLSAELVQDITTETREVIQAHALEAANTVIGLMQNASSERVRQTSAFDILDRAGFKAKDVSVRASVNLDREDAERIRDAIYESRQEPEDLEMVQDTAGVFKAREKEQKKS
jgi:hypothetical protein